MHHRIVLNNENNDIIYISKSVIDDSFSSSPHSHPNLELILPISGTGYVISSFDKYKVSKNNLVIINSNISHFEMEKGFSYYAIGVNNLDIFKDKIDSSNIIIEALNESEERKYKFLFDLIYKSTLEIDDISLEIIKSAYSIIYNSLKKTYNIRPIVGQIYSDDVIKIKNFIDNFYSSDIKLSDISKRLNSSISSLCHKFKNETGKTIIEYKINRQLEEAYNLLMVSNMTVIDISNFVGFNNVSYFNKLFKKKYNKTPKEINGKK